jgi:transposase
MKRRYELRDDQWEPIRNLLLTERKSQGGRTSDKGQSTDAQCDTLGSSFGSEWRDLHGYYGPWNSVYTRFR